mgnify:CR=1 FL=1
MRAYSSLSQLEEKGICVDEYLTNERDGVFKARLDCKRWGKKRNILAYFTFEDGSKVMASAWQNTGYLGMQIASLNGHLCHIWRPACDLNGGQPRTH